MTSKPTEAELLRIAKDIRLLCLDVDGVLTDGAMYYDANGEALKRFYTRDAAGLVLIRKFGIEVAWLTAENSPITAARAKKLKIDRIFLGCQDKLTTAKDLCKELDLQLSQVAYMGDDWFDIPLLEKVGLSACPADAQLAVQDVTMFRSSFPGGNGAVRELCELFVELSPSDN